MNGLPLDRYAAHVHPDDRERFKREVAYSQRVGGSFLIEYLTQSASDGVRFLLDRGEFEMGPAGQAVAARGILVDLTDRLDKHAIKGNVFLSAGFQNRPLLERAIEHALALYELIGAIEGSPGQDASVNMRNVLLILGQEIARLIGANGRQFNPSGQAQIH